MNLGERIRAIIAYCTAPERAKTHVKPLGSQNRQANQAVRNPCGLNHSHKGETSTRRP